MSPSELQMQTGVADTMLDNGLRGVVQRGFVTDQGNRGMVVVTLYRFPTDGDAAKAKDRVLAASATAPNAAARTELPSLDATIVGPINPAGGSSHFWTMARKGQYVVTVEQLANGLVAADTTAVADQLARLP